MVRVRERGGDRMREGGGAGLGREGGSGAVGKPNQLTGGRHHSAEQQSPVSAEALCSHSPPDGGGVISQRDQLASETE